MPAATKRGEGLGYVIEGIAQPGVAVFVDSVGVCLEGIMIDTAFGE
ncbi:MAG: hypothetical protein ACR2H3_07450 [Acidimicrobiales bacterium]